MASGAARGRWSAETMSAIAGAAGLCLLLVVPGYYLGRLLVAKTCGVERAVLSVALSLGVNMLVGVLLALAGSFTPVHVWTAALGVSLGLFGLHWLVHREVF